MILNFKALEKLDKKKKEQKTMSKNAKRLFKDLGYEKAPKYCEEFIVYIHKCEIIYDIKKYYDNYEKVMLIYNKLFERYKSENDNV